MAFVDEIHFFAKAGDGGSGVVRWRHERSKEYSGAAGGNGGHGGDLFVRAVRDTNILSRYKTVKRFEAGRGQDGQSNSMQGKAGIDHYIDLPIGSIVTNLTTKRQVELLEEGQISKILHGGKGGLGNEHFKASTNVRPEQSTPGASGEEADFVVELNLIADAGFIGLPNAGKTSLLNALTHAKAKVADYAFTTLDPNLGVLHEHILADIPGLIEGASDGKGLGYKFLRHIKRVKMLVHVISLESCITPSAGTSPHNLRARSATRLFGEVSGFGRDEVLSIKKNYNTIRDELEKYGHGLSDKPEMIVLTKTDLVDKKVITEAKKVLKKKGVKILSVSILDDKALSKLADEIVKILGKNK
ncbi:MAG: Obg family GTPase CgtA [Candidatus Taylorbacteria bacterium RIFCSPLOWO2_01_FULL_44_26]|uniref:GTPase Obg n=2 Tax=Candidatus Tayloriibacteriota TaxID=1817919 RepID=A0A1G2MJH8_9BACT|nr:MAG: Obg family GTPase CgtA [Candidatus Taylorbacteria bacterium RIFCSPHIGHO2_02_FULL_44_12]OHA30748.1 MAG: Obg family GTPase CgtA [Candidatus Taylorbacteria bacterium RIFCSPLOWO2_01_FULL_44_26]